MPTYEAYSDFTPQSHAVKALLQMYALLEQEPPINVPYTPIVVFTAFTIESYLNSIGTREIPYWAELERLSWRSKIEILHANAKKTSDWGRDPLQFAIGIFKVRDKLAHGKAERVTGPVMPRTFDNQLQPDWLKLIDKVWLGRAKHNFFELMKYLGNLYGYHESDYLQLSTGGTLSAP